MSKHQAANLKYQNDPRNIHCHPELDSGSIPDQARNDSKGGLV